MYSFIQIEISLYGMTKTIRFLINVLQYCGKVALKIKYNLTLKTHLIAREIGHVSLVDKGQDEYKL